MKLDQITVTFAVLEVAVCQTILRVTELAVLFSMVNT